MPLVRDWARVFPPRALVLSLPMLSECCPLWVTGGSSRVGHPRVHQSSVRKAKCQCIPRFPPPSSEESLRGCCCLLKTSKTLPTFPFMCLGEEWGVWRFGAALSKTGDSALLSQWCTRPTCSPFSLSLSLSVIVLGPQWATAGCEILFSTRPPRAALQASICYSWSSSEHGFVKNQSSVSWSGWHLLASWVSLWASCTISAWKPPVGVKGSLAVKFCPLTQGQCTNEAGEL